MTNGNVNISIQIPIEFREQILNAIQHKYWPHTKLATGIKNTLTELVLELEEKQIQMNLNEKK